MATYGVVLLCSRLRYVFEIFVMKDLEKKAKEEQQTQRVPWVEA